MAKIKNLQIMTILDQPEISAQPMVYASFGERVVARIIDGMILILPSMFVPFIFPWLYFAFQEGSKSGATIGKRAMGIRVLSGEGQPIGFGVATGRFLGNLLNIFTFFIGYLVMLFNARNQCLHDMITGTVVVKNSPALSDRPFQQQAKKRSWTSKVSDSETHFVEIGESGGRHWRRTAAGQQVNDFTLWQMTDDKVDVSNEFGPQAYQEMKSFAAELLRAKA